MVWAQKQQQARQGPASDPRVSLWEPPQSPYGLIEEELFGNPWRLLVACILLNKTSIVQALALTALLRVLCGCMPTPQVSQLVLMMCSSHACHSVGC